MGGDAGANAAIVGGMVGAIVGIKRGLPQHMLHALLRFDCTSGRGMRRDSAYSVKKNGVHLARMLLDNRPRENLIILHEEEEFQDGDFGEIPNEIHATSTMISGTSK